MATTRKSPGASGNIVSRRILVVVDRDMSAKTPRVIWQHEKPILEAIFGEGNIKEVDPATMDEGYTAKVSPALLVHNKRQDIVKRPSESVGIGYAFCGDARAEYDRMGAAYGMHPENPVSCVEYVYGRFQEGRFEAVVGAAAHEDMPDAQLRDVLIEQGFLPMVTKESTDAERREAGDARKRLNDMPRAELLKLADEYTGATA